MASQRDLPYNIAAHLLDCVCDALTRTEIGCPNRRCIVPGNEAETVNCCDNQGQVTVALPRLFPSSSFPTVDTQTQGCDAPLTVVVYNIEVWRCMPVGHMQYAPTCDELDNTAYITMQDAWAMRTGVSCCFKDKESITEITGPGYRWMIGDHSSLGPEGACVGNRLEVAIGYLTCWEC